MLTEEATSKVRRTLYWLVVIPIYIAAVVYLLRGISPVFMDGGGPMPSFYWGHMPAPTLKEYFSRRSYFDLLFLFPYIVAASIIAILGCVVARAIARHVRALSSHPFWGSTLATLVLLLLTGVISDAGGALGAWFGPRILVHPYYASDLILIAKLLIVPSVLCGLAIFGELHLIQTSKSLPPN